jgi:hypothetical protein
VQKEVCWAEHIHFSVIITHRRACCIFKVCCC